MLIKEPECSFCGKTKKEVRNFVHGQGEVFICEICVNDSAKIIEKNKGDDDLKLSLTPREVYERLCQYVIGQDSAKRILATEVREHYKRITAPQTNYVELEKSNVLLIGPTGSGKTLLLKTISTILNVPFAVGDATSFTQAGYVGNDVESVLTTLLINSDFNIQKAEKGIVFIDEIDKVSRKGESPSLTRDVTGEGVQQSLLKMIEGSECLIPTSGSLRKHPQQECISFNTKDVLFILGGSFDGLSDIIKKRISTSSTMGFAGTVTVKSQKTSVNDFFPYVMTEDLIKFGMIPELLGRIPMNVTLDELSRSELRQILVEPKNSLVKQFKLSFELDNVELEFSSECLDIIVDKAIERKTGARGLRSIVKELLLEYQFNLPEMEPEKEGETIKLNIDGETAKGIFDKIEKMKLGKAA